MADDAYSRPALFVHGAPLPHRSALANSALMAALRVHWQLVAVSGRTTFITNRGPTLVERGFRALDRKLFGRGRWQIAKHEFGDAPITEPTAQSLDWQLSWDRAATLPPGTDALCVEFEGRPMSELEEAARLRIGQRGGILNAQVWRLRDGHADELLMVGGLRLDHRSLHRSVVLCAAKIPQLLIGALARRQHPGAHGGDAASQSSTPLSALALIGRIARTSLCWLRFREQWQTEVGRSAEAAQSLGDTVAELRSPDAAWWADPFLLRVGQRTWVLFEELLLGSQRGHISALEIDDTGRALSTAKVVLREPWHLSYPFIWHEAGRTFMLPEAGNSGQLTLYEAVDGALEWQRSAVLLSGVRLADATVVAFDGRLWMFATTADPGALMDDALNIYWAARIEGPWHAHAMNPVKIDARSARPAGSMWVRDDVLFRVVQDCSSTYGGSTVCMRVLKLTEYEFQEEPVPEWARLKAKQKDPWHTFNSIGNLNVIDRLVRRPRWQK